MTTWPASLPQEIAGDSYKETVPDTTIRSQMETGPAKVRSRFTVGIPAFEVSLIMSEDQVATLDTFYVTTLALGVSQFTWTHPRTAAAVTTFRFTKAPEYSYKGGLMYSVNLSLEILP
jgi:hypothetical protein